MLTIVKMMVNKVERGGTTEEKWEVERYYDTEDYSVDYFFCPVCNHKVCIEHLYGSVSPSYPQKCSNCETKFGILR